jgi:uncharacterized protein (DUF983 family)
MTTLATTIALIKFKCPRCHNGTMFSSSNPYNLKRITEMPKECACCGQLTEPEPGFYYGAMFSSYILCVGIFLINFFIFGVYLNFTPIKFLSLYISQLFILMPFIFRYARLTFLYMFVSYDSEAIYKFRRKAV